jgi:hypothetical protein
MKCLQKSETKPFTNFAVFHDNLISRLKAVTNIQSDFEKRCKEAESKFVDKLTYAWTFLIPSSSVN